MQVLTSVFKHYKINLVQRFWLHRCQLMEKVCSFSLYYTKLSNQPYVINLSILLSGERFTGIVDLLYLNKHLWDADSKGTETCTVTPLKESSDGHLWELAVKSREDLIDRLSSYDDKLAEDIISEDSLEKITAPMLSSALRRATILCVC